LKAAEIDLYLARVDYISAKSALESTIKGLN